ncbi:Nuclear GTPase SLIP-GC, partial [Tinamus guttatus]
AERGNAEEIARKRPRLPQAFQDDEQKLLKNYENIESKARKILNLVHERMKFVDQLGDAPSQLTYLRDRLTTLQEKSTFSVTSIGLFGSTGAGKSTLLNTLLGKEYFLPVSGTQTCTSCQVRVSVCRSKDYEAKIFLLSEQEWKDELEHLLAFLEEHEDDEEDESNKDVELAISKLRTVYGEGAERRSYEELLRATPKVNISSTGLIAFQK